MSRLSVQLVVWNGAKYLPYLFDSLRKQNCKDWFLVILDNNSTDNTVEVIRQELNDFNIQHKLITNKENKGFAGGHAQAFKENDSEYVLLLNQDMYLMPDCLEKMVEFLNNHPEAGAVTPRLMRWDFSFLCHSDEGQNLKNLNINDERSRIKFGMTNVIDALGLKIFRNRRVIEAMTGLEWPINQATVQPINVFGVSGAFPMYRRSALVDTFLSDGDFLDSSYFMYKEDVDLAYRLASRGWQSFVLLDSVAYHDRTGAGPKELSDSAALKNKKNHSALVRYHSYKNHLMTLYKNEYGQNFILDFPWILWYELKKFVYFLLFDRAVLAGLREVWNLRHELVSKRQHIKKLREVDWKQVRLWWRQ